MKPPLLLGLSLLALLSLPQTAVSQSASPPTPDIQQLNGYTIRIMRMERGSYGYEIRRGSEVLVHQRRNPFTGSEAGLTHKEDALKTATWLLQNVLTKEQMLSRSRQLPQRVWSRPIPATVATSLGINLDNQR
jgi:hypothetical protein